MSAYLKIAYLVLKASQRPMTADGILKAAYAAEIVPKHLYGKTQTKTLQARLSEDILYRSASPFFRTEPGKYFLTEFLSDSTIPAKFKKQFHARRRSRDLNIPPFLVFDPKYLNNYDEANLADWRLFAAKAEAANAIQYIHSKKDAKNSVLAWTFSIVRRGTSVLTYRTGKYRSEDEKFANRRTIGFTNIISLFDCTLFSDGDFGARENAMFALSADLDISAATFASESIQYPHPLFALRTQPNGAQESILVVMDWNCPTWFEPTTRRLSINDLQWIDLTVNPNNFDDFEPWTQAVLLGISKSLEKL